MQMRSVTFLALVASALAVATASAGHHDPTGVHLSFGDEEDQMVVTWSTAKSTDADVRYAPSDPESSTPANLTLSATGTVREFADGGSGRTTRYVHAATLRGLAPGVRYEYQVGDASLEKWSATFWFTSRRDAKQLADQTTPPLRLIALCDIGLKRSEPVLKLLANEVHGAGKIPPDAFVQCGDFAYDLDSDDGAVGDDFLAAMEPIAAYVPWMTSAGNHENSDNFTHYRERFTMPNKAQTDNHYYSLDLGPVHLVAYNTEAFFWPEMFGAEYAARMYAWLERDLGSVDRKKTPWVVVHGHRPMYCPTTKTAVVPEDYDGEDDYAPPSVPPAPERETVGKKKKPDLGGLCKWEQESSRLGVPSMCANADGTNCARFESVSYLESSPEERERSDPPRFPLEALFHAHGVDVAFYGHEHEYWRSFPVFNETVVNGTGTTSLETYREPRGTVHVVTGAGGNDNMDLGDEPPSRGRCAELTGKGKDLNPASWCAFQSGVDVSGGRTSEFAYGIVTFWSGTRMTWEQFSALDDGAKIDEWHIETSKHGPFANRLLASGSRAGIAAE
jgi:acid phosphatase type 7